MNIMIVRSIGLSESCSDAWKAVGGYFPKRERSMESKLALHRSRGPDQPIINLGDTTFNPTDLNLQSYGLTGPVFNLGDNIRHITQPGRTRARLGEFLPPYPTDLIGTRDVWVKAPGQAGQGKERYETMGGALPRIPPSWDLQMHVDGQEYRVVTVDDKVVQVSERYGPDSDRRYAWLGVKRAPVPVKEIAREAARRLDGRNIIGWDVIMGEAPNSTYILEGNSCPGVNHATAARIIAQVEGETYE